MANGNVSGVGAGLVGVGAGLGGTFLLSASINRGWIDQTMGNRLTGALLALSIGSVGVSMGDSLGLLELDPGTRTALLGLNLGVFAPLALIGAGAAFRPGDGGTEQQVVQQVPTLGNPRPVPA